MIEETLKRLECQEPNLSLSELLEEVNNLANIALSDNHKRMILRMLDRIFKYYPDCNMDDLLYSKIKIDNPFAPFIFVEYPKSDRKIVKTLEDALLVNNWADWHFGEFLNIPIWRKQTKEEYESITDFNAVVFYDAEPSKEIKDRINIYFDQLLSERGVRCTKALRAKFHQES